jgi:hypothetical protein
MLNAEMSVADRECLDEFVNLRHQLAADMDMSATDEDALPHYQSNEIEEMSTHELLIAEVYNKFAWYFDWSGYEQRYLSLLRCRRTRFLP